MIIFELTTEMAIPKGFSSTCNIKNWGLIGYLRCVGCIKFIVP